MPQNSGSWMLPEISASAQFSVHRRKVEIQSFTRAQLEAEIVRLMEWDVLKKAQLNGALKHITELEAKIAALQPAAVDPLQQWMDMGADLLQCLARDQAAAASASPSS